MRLPLLIVFLLLTAFFQGNVHFASAACSQVQNSNIAKPAALPIIARIEGHLKKVVTKNGVTTAIFIPEKWQAGEAYAAYAENSVRIYMQTSVASEACGQGRFIRAAHKKIIVGLSDAEGLQTGKVTIREEDELFPWTGKSMDTDAMMEVYSGIPQRTLWQKIRIYVEIFTLIFVAVPIWYRRYMGLPAKGHNPAL